MGTTIFIMNNPNIEEEKNTAIIFTKLGNHIVNNYFYELYKKEKDTNYGLISNNQNFNFFDWKKKI